jgi:hypothetical protein
MDDQSNTDEALREPKSQVCGDDLEFQTTVAEYIRAGYQCLFVPTVEEARLEAELRKMAQKANHSLISWSAASGFSGPPTLQGAKYRGIHEALQLLPENKPFSGDAVFMFKDATDFFADPMARRILRSLCEGNQLVNPRHTRPLVLSAPNDIIHDSLKPCVTIVDFKLPAEPMLRRILDFVKASISKKSAQGRRIDFTEEFADQIVGCLRGLTSTEAENVLARCLVRHQGFEPEMLGTIKEEKAQIIRKSEMLTYIPESAQATRDQIGGFDLLLEYVDRRRLAYTRDARAINLDYPKGVVLLGVPGTGKCLGRGTPVLMANGTVKPVENVAVGDKLMGPDSTARTVRNTTTGRGPLYRVTPVKGDSYVINDAHILSFKRTGTEEIVNLSVPEYLARGDASREQLKGWRTGVDWPAHSVDIPPYILGVWLGDGTSTAPYITTGQAMTYGITKDKGGQDYTGNAFYEGLRQYGLFANKHIPHEYLANDRQVRLELLAGLIDSGGHLHCSGYEISTKFNQLASDILFLARSLGFAAYASVTEKHDQRGRGGLYFRIFIRGTVAEIPVRIPRKQAGPRLQARDVLKTGITVEPCGEGDYFGFELDGDRMFLLGDFTVTHNSYVAMAMGRLLGLPVYILDIGAVFGHLVGQSESRMRMALKLIEAQQGCVLVLDEADKALGGAADASQDSGVTRRVFGQFLTWLANKQDRTFVVMTLNRTKGIPPEFLRAGRFDAVFFTDLPHDQERRQIFEIHFHKRGVDPVSLEMGEAEWGMLIEKTKDFVGSEVEEIVKEARYIAFERRRVGLPTFEEILEAHSNVRPISTLDAENVSAIAQFGRDRARSVSSPPKRRQATRAHRSVDLG